MAAISHRLLRLRPVHRSHPSPLHFSSEPNSEPDPKPQPSFSSYLTDVKASLHREPPPHNRPQTLRRPPSSTPPPSPPSRIADLDEIRRNLSAFRSRSAPSPPPPDHQPPVSLQELYNRNTADSSSSSSSAAPSFAPIRDSLQHLRSSLPKNTIGKSVDNLSLTRFKESLKMKPGDKTEGSLPSFIDREAVGKGNVGGDVAAGARTGFVKSYDYAELGGMLKMLRPERRKGKWFSLGELNERLAKLRQIEEKEGQKAVIGGLTITDLRETLVKLSQSPNEKANKNMVQRIDLLSQLGGTPSFMLSPPKDELVEKYFHPDNMSSAEKLKLELKKVRDEFKMSESDCGSARVQVAQLTTKIKHLSTVLQKKDKHSRKGLQEMVQRRKKLLKYLRRTDWDSYCLVLSKLGLRDNPDVKA